MKRHYSNEYLQNELKITNSKAVALKVSTALYKRAIRATNKGNMTQSELNQVIAELESIVATK